MILNELQTIAVDSKGNTYLLYLPIQGKMSFLRVGGVNYPTSLSTVDESSCVSFSKSGSSHMIELVSDKDAIISELCTAKSSSLSIIPIDKQESNYIGFSNDRCTSVIRKIIS